MKGLFIANQARHKLRTFFVLLAVCVLSVGCVPPGGPGGRDLGAEPQRRAVSHGGRERSYLIQKPEGTGGGKAPVVVLLHAWTSRAEDVWKQTTLPIIARENGAILVAPNAVDRSWSTIPGEGKVDDVAFIGSVIDEVVARDNGDPARVYVTGLSQGAGMAFALACEMGDRLAAIAPVSTTMTEGLSKRCRLKKPLSVMVVAGTDDPMVSYEGGHPFGNRDIPRALSAPNTIDFWVGHNACGRSPQATDMPDRNTSDGSSVRKIDYTGCRDGVEVLFYRVEGGGHTWPGGTRIGWAEKIFGKTNQDIDSGEELWAFFQRQSR